MARMGQGEVQPSIAEGLVGSNAKLPAVIIVHGDDAPVKVLDASQLRMLGTNISKLFGSYRSDRRVQELRWTRNLRQYLGFYDPEVEKLMAPERSRAYPKITRIKCISMLARIMDLMFPSDDENWTLNARPSADMELKDVMAAIKAMTDLDTAVGQQPPQPMTKEYVQAAVQDLATKRAKALALEIRDQLQELGGDQSYDYVALNNEVVASGILYGLGTLTGPYARAVTTASWDWDDAKQTPVAKTITVYMPQFHWLPVWDYYPDMSAKRLEDGDGHFTRQVMSKQQVRKLADREDFFSDVIKTYLRMYPTGNYKAQEFETELRSMGVKVNVNEQKADTTKYEVITWHGPIDGSYLRAAGVEVADDKLADQIDAEVWMIEETVIKAVMNPWAELGIDVRTIHNFIFDKDDTAVVGFGLPNVLRDTQMSISASVRMMLDNASVVCGPILEVNTALLRADQDLTAISAYKTYYRDDEGPTSQFPAVRDIKVESHINELEQIVSLCMKFADAETFVGPMTGGDTSKMPSEPMRNAAGASMLMGNAALPFKQIIRNFDRFTQSVILSIVQFNRKFNPLKAPAADFDVIARGATSLIAKELRGIQVDQLSTSLSPEERIHVDTRKLVEARFAVRDLDEMLVSETEAARRQAAQDQQAAQQQQVTQAQVEAQTRNLLSMAFKNIAQGQKNQVNANAEAVATALDILEKGMDHAIDATPSAQPANDPGAEGAPAPADQALSGGADQSTSQPDPTALGAGGGVVTPTTGGMPMPGFSPAPGAG